MSFDPSTVPLLSLFISASVGMFGVYTWRTKANSEELEKLKNRVRELEIELRFANSERSRLEMKNIELMSRIIEVRNNPPP